LRFVFIRHGQPAWIVDDAGRDDPLLTELGERQAAAVGRRESSLKINEIWVSPLRRAQQTAAPLGSPSVTLEFLRELRTPPIEGMSREDIAARYAGARERPIAEWWGGIAGGETNRAFVGRIGKGFDDHFASLGFRWEDRDGHRMWFDIPQDGTVAIVCHAGTTGAAIAHLLALPQVPWAWERFRLWHTGVAVLQTVPVADGLVFSMEAFNDQSHLSPEERTR